jgi:orotidine-5'-phosphate decarboxylase
VARRSSQLVLGLDPDLTALWPAAESAAGDGSPAQRAAAAVREQCRLLIDAAGPACVAVKPQVAFFERLGAPGWAALEATVAHAQAAGLIVLADVKRGDVPHVAGVYAQGLVGKASESPFGEIRGLGADAFTVNPLMGRDVLDALVQVTRPAGAGIFVLVRTSNPGAADVEDLELAGGAPLWERLAAIVDRLGASGLGESGLADVGAVTGATEPQHLARMRELMPRTPFLLPGVGAQGGEVEALAPAFAPGHAGGLVSASRSIANAYEVAGDPLAAPQAAAAEAERLREIAWTLASA